MAFLPQRHVHKHYSLYLQHIIGMTYNSCQLLINVTAEQNLASLTVMDILYGSTSTQQWNG